MSCFDKESKIWWPFNVGGPLNPEPEEPVKIVPTEFVQQEPQPKKRKKRSSLFGQAQTDLGTLKLGKGGILGQSADQLDKARSMFG